MRLLRRMILWLLSTDQHTWVSVCSGVWEAVSRVTLCLFPGCDHLREPAAAAVARGEAGVQGRGGERGAHRVQRSHGGRGQPPAEAGEERKGAGRDRAKAAATRRKNR